MNIYDGHKKTSIQDKTDPIWEEDTAEIICEVLGGKWIFSLT